VTRLTTAVGSGVQALAAIITPIFVTGEPPMSQQSVGNPPNAFFCPRVSNQPRGRRPDAVTAVMRGAYEVQLANGFTVRAMLSGRMMRHKIRVTVGRNVRSWGEAEGADSQTPLNSNDPKGDIAEPRYGPER
jgi:hypothetical protein